MAYMTATARVTSGLPPLSGGLGVSAILDATVLWALASEAAVLTDNEG
jgi:hypothetical protein